MKNILFITPRQVGKTKLAKYEYIKDPTSRALLFLNQEMIKHANLKNNINVFSINQIEDKFRQRTYKVVIVDEYLFLSDHQMDILNELQDSMGFDIIAFSTPNKIYSSFLIDYVTTNKSMMNVNEMVDDIKLHYKSVEPRSIYAIDDLKKDLSSLSGNILTNNNTKIIHYNDVEQLKIFNIPPDFSNIGMDPLSIDMEGKGKYKI